MGHTIQQGGDQICLDPMSLAYSGPQVGMLVASTMYMSSCHRYKQQFLSWHGLLVSLLVSLAKRLLVACITGPLAINYLTLSVQRATSTVPNPRKINLVIIIRDSGVASTQA